MISVGECMKPNRSHHD